MKNTTTLLVIEPDTSDAVIAEQAEQAFAQNTHLSVLMIGDTPVLPTYAYGMPMYGNVAIPENWAQTAASTRNALVERETEIKAVLDRGGASADVQSLLCATMDIKEIVATHARICDTAYIPTGPEGLSDSMRQAAHGILFKSPIGLMLNASPSKPAPCVFIAWNNSDTVAKVVHVALPYLVEAREVIIACFDPTTTKAHTGEDPGTDVAAWLSHHGCNVTVTQFPTGGQEVAACILDRAKEQGADLVVMGAYGHARMMQAVFGGTTRSMLDQTDQPVLLAH
ncbi:nucleotide-binding universal stress UspA family protein [Yoonia maritima]|uniref:Nucleotide-binding universal stress UspA family protein n=1 Tax=Yoonia maritima TaxID=1435347 RepID=A0A2T0W503_9RHOB|nr:universal stress protein [Yoonia maritima]PRY80559.1 nucleotide-binding universal stress UspA family protein [Yoonia maritima]